VLAAQVRDRAWNDIRCYGELASAHCHQSETGLNYNWNRDYDPLTGAYIESDPLGLIAGIDTYNYVAASPEDLRDPEGLSGTGYLPPQTPQANIGWPMCDGHDGITIQFPTDPMVRRCIGDCLAVHESVHIRDLRNLNPTICKNVPPHWVPGFTDKSAANASEVRAYEAELQCLRKKLESLSDCDDCKKFIEYEINSDIPSQIRHYSK
jgi:RHS repeat-associated protein